MLKARNSAGGDDAECGGTSFYELTDEGLEWNAMWLLLAGGELLLFAHFATTAFLASPKIHLLVVSISKILYDDISVFVIVYLWTCTTFLSVLYTLYPRSGEGSLALFEEMNNFVTAAAAVFELSLIGEPIAMDSDFLATPATWQTMSSPQNANLTLWLLLYVLFILLSIILLLNLLIALLTYTFDGVREVSLLTSRLIFAQKIIRLELVAESLCMHTRCGERTLDGRYTYNFRSVDTRQTFGADAGDGYAGALHGGANPFEEPLPTPIGRVERSLAELRARVEALSATNTNPRQQQAAGPSAAP